MGHHTPDEQGWCRTRPLAETAAILESSASRFGVVRVGSITRLDSIDIATVTAVRRDPIGESISVCTGKGPTELHARVGALSEALERYCAEPRGRLRTLIARADELPDANLAPEYFALPDGVSGRRPIEWCAGVSLDNARRVWIPASAVFFPYAAAKGTEKLFAAHTTGLATGASAVEALVFALLECIERDAYSRAVALASVGRGNEIPVVDLAVACEAVPEELRRILSCHHDVLIRDLACDTDVPCYLCSIHDGMLTHFGVAARPDAREALRASVQEAAQSRLTDIQGAREDFPDRSSLARVDSWFLKAGKAPTIPIRASWKGASAAEVLANIGARLRAMSSHLAGAWINLSLEGVDLAVVRAVTPGLEVWAFDPSRIGPRGRRWLDQRQ